MTQLFTVLWQEGKLVFNSFRMCACLVGHRATVRYHECNVPATVL